jgi:hypothetical protein
MVEGGEERGERFCGFHHERRARRSSPLRGWDDLILE